MLLNDHWPGWDRLDAWPQSDPPGYLFLGHAFNLLGLIRYADWSPNNVQIAQRKTPERIPPASEAYDELGAPQWGIHNHYRPVIEALTPSLAAGSPIPFNLWNTIAYHTGKDRSLILGAQIQRRTIADELAFWAQHGIVQFAARVKGGGRPVELVTADSWALDDPFVPFATLGMHNVLGLASLETTHWLFAEASSLASALGSVEDLTEMGRMESMLLLDQLRTAPRTADPVASVEREAVEPPQAQPPGIERRAGGRPDAERVEELAHAFDAEGISKRQVTASMIAARWQDEWGSCPTIDNVKALMDGGQKGRRPGK